MAPRRSLGEEENAPRFRRGAATEIGAEFVPAVHAAAGHEGVPSAGMCGYRAREIPAPGRNAAGNLGCAPGGWRRVGARIVLRYVDADATRRGGDISNSRNKRRDARVGYAWTRSAKFHRRACAERIGANLCSVLHRRILAWHNRLVYLHNNDVTEAPRARRRKK